MWQLSKQDGLEPAPLEEEVDAFFCRTDADDSGTIEFSELNSALRSGSSITLEAEMQAGAVGEIHTKAENRFALRSPTALRRNLARFSGSYKVDGKSKKSLVKQLSDTIRRNKLRAYDFFRDWDADHNGTLQREEFCAAMYAMGFTGDDDAIHRAFDEIDLDGNGEIGLREMEKALQQYLEVDMAPGITYEFRADSRSPRSLLLELRLNRNVKSSMPGPVASTSSGGKKKREGSTHRGRAGAARRNKRELPKSDETPPTTLFTPRESNEYEDPLEA